MKYFLVGCAALAVCVSAVAMRPAERVVVRRERVEVPVRVNVPVEVEVEKVVASTQSITRVEKAPGRPAGSEAPGGEVLARSNMIFLFERELHLTADQRAHLRAVLEGRQSEIDAVQAQVVASGVFVAREYERRIRGIQEASYRRMAAEFDAAQKRRFFEILSEGRFGDAVEFDLPDSLVVIQ